LPKVDGFTQTALERVWRTNDAPEIGR